MNNFHDDFSRDVAHRRRVAEQIFDVLGWTDEACGFCACPGEEFHTSRTGPKDCRVTIDGIPTAYCVHQSCQEEVGRANFKLRRAILGVNNPVPPLEIAPVKFPKPSPKSGAKQFE